MTWTIAVFGGDPAALPAHPAIRWCAAGNACDALLLQGVLSEQDWLRATRDVAPLTPVGAVAPITTGADIILPRLDPPALDAMLATFQAIQARRAAMAEVPSQGMDGAELAVLGLAHSRTCALNATRSPHTLSSALYALLERRPGLAGRDRRALCESLANADLLSRSFSHRILTCPSCQSGRLSAYEACAACGSAHLHEETLIHHYRCGLNAPENQFTAGSELICPKCRRHLKHFGVDYGRPGTVIQCRSCQAATSEPLPKFTCLDCQADFKGGQAVPQDWYDYALTELGSTAALSGVLPHSDFITLLHSLPRTYTEKEFRLVIREQLLVARRYKRPFALGRVHIADLPAMRQNLGIGPTSAALRLFSNVLIENLRSTDFVAAPRQDLLFVAMPETDAATAQPVLSRIVATAQAALQQSIELAVDAIDAAEIESVMAELA